VTLLIAGHETTATALAWASSGSCATRRGGPAAGGADAADAYIDAVVKEDASLAARVIDVARTLAAPARLGGYDLPAGVMVVPMITLVQTGPGSVGGRRRVRPERFLDGAQPDPYTWIPFGGGVRRCLGASFATFEIKVVLETISPPPDLLPSLARAGAARLPPTSRSCPRAGGEVVLERRRPVRTPECARDGGWRRLPAACRRAHLLPHLSALRGDLRAGDHHQQRRRDGGARRTPRTSSRTASCVRRASALKALHEIPTSCGRRCAATAGGDFEPSAGTRPRGDRRAPDADPADGGRNAWASTSATRPPTISPRCSMAGVFSRRSGRATSTRPRRSISTPNAVRVRPDVRHGVQRAGAQTWTGPTT